jgi:hypothetical protein
MHTLHTFRVALSVHIEAPDAEAAADAAAWLAAAVVRDRRHRAGGAELAAVAVGEPVDAGAAAAEAGEVAARRAAVALGHARTLAGERGAGLRPAAREEPAPPTPTRPRRWTAAEDALVLADPGRPAAALGRALGRTAGAVHQRRRRLRGRDGGRRGAPARGRA